MPKPFKACCDVFESHTSACEFDIRYEWWTRSKHWYIIISDIAGGGGIEIEYCPHCGSSLKRPAA